MKQTVRIAGGISELFGTLDENLKLFEANLHVTTHLKDHDLEIEGEPAQGLQILEWNGRRLGISICEDVWNDRDFWQRRRYHEDPVEALAAAGVDAILNLSASPFTAGKQPMR